MAKTTNELILDDIISRSVDISRYELELQNKVNKILKDIENDLVKNIIDINPTAPKYKIHQINRLKKLLEQSRATIATGYKNINNLTASETQQLSVIEGEWAKDLLTVNMPSAAAAQVSTVAVSDALLKELAKDTLIGDAPSAVWWKGILLKGRKEKALYENFKDSMTVGIYEGESLPKLLKRIKNPTNPGYIGLKTVTKNNAEALVRTSVQTVTNRAREAVYTANSHLISALKWISTLDIRTTTLCIVRDNKLYTVDTHQPIGHSYLWSGGPGSLHWSCRSSSTIVLKSAKELGIDQTGFRTTKDYDSALNSIDGKVPADTDYIKWLSQQPAEAQNKVLGKTRAELYRTGKVKRFSTLVDQTGRQRPLKSLSAYKG